MPAHFEGSTTEKNLAALQVSQASRYGCAIENYLSQFSIKTYVRGTQKSCLDETALLSTRNMF